MRIGRSISYVMVVLACAALPAAVWAQGVPASFEGTAGKCVVMYSIKAADGSLVRQKLVYTNASGLPNVGVESLQHTSYTESDMFIRLGDGSGIFLTGNCQNCGTRMPGWLGGTGIVVLEGDLAWDPETMTWAPNTSGRCIFLFDLATDTMCMSMHDGSPRTCTVKPGKVCPSYGWTATVTVDGSGGISGTYDDMVLVDVKLPAISLREIVP